MSAKKSKKPAEIDQTLDETLPAALLPPVDPLETDIDTGLKSGDDDMVESVIVVDTIGRKFKMLATDSWNCAANTNKNGNGDGTYTLTIKGKDAPITFEGERNAKMLDIVRRGHF
jgi:hypothetical protein